ncbi:hypothetical protein [Actinomadura rupiterrae]|uniref:hypothetical protein n=1 Tax=Actinomadura rupiterrae TaxID=559627 RepID=UPI0020A3CA54|nr:hypothetical protein [Actinomadura rupiterrae]MCP2336722.1 translation initiation factor IF-2 [Actinomadura rupiterrae]
MDNDGARGSRRPTDAGDQAVPDETAPSPGTADAQAVSAALSAEGEAKPETEAEAEAGTSTEAEAGPVASAGTGAEGGRRFGPDAEAKVAAKAEAEAKAKAKAAVKTDAKAEAVADVEADADAEAKAEGKAKARGFALATTAAAKPKEQAVGKPSKPALAGAVLVGLVLLAVPLAVATVGGGDHSGKKEQPVAFGGLHKPGDSGYVPGVTDPKLGPAPTDGTGGGGGNGGNGGGGGGGAPSTSPSGGAGGKAGDGTPEKPGGAPNAGAPKGDKAHSVSVTALAGPGCPSSTGGGYRLIGHNEDWHTRIGSSPGNGCSGRFSTVPMTGASNKDGENSVLWTFDTGQVQNGTCQLSVYVPSGGIKDVGGAPAYYTVGGSAFTVDQTSNQDSWVDVGSYPVSGGSLTVKLHDRGIDWGSRSGAHLAAGAMRAICKP